MNMENAHHAILWKLESETDLLHDAVQHTNETEQVRSTGNSAEAQALGFTKHGLDMHSIESVCTAVWTWTNG